MDAIVFGIENQVNTVYGSAASAHPQPFYIVVVGENKKPDGLLAGFRRRLIPLEGIFVVAVIFASIVQLPRIRRMAVAALFVRAPGVIRLGRTRRRAEEYPGCENSCRYEELKKTRHTLRPLSHSLVMLQNLPPPPLGLQ